MESKKSFSQAFLAAQKAIEQPKRTAENPHYRSRYAPLDEVIRVARKALHKEGIAFSQRLDYEAGVIYVSTLFFYDGEKEVHEAGRVGMPCPSDPQRLGAVITYLRRYALSAALGLSSEEDDDANSASIGEKVIERNEDLPATQQQLRMLYARGYDAGLEKEEIKKVIDNFVIENEEKKIFPRERIDDCLAAIEEKAAKKKEGEEKKDELF